MKELPQPQPGQPIRAQDAAEHIRGTKAALSWSVDGMDLEQHGSGQAAVIRPKESLQLVEIASEWKHVPPGKDTETQPTAWHYCDAYLLQRGLGQAEAWAKKKPEDRICLWAPTAYPGYELLRDKLRGKLPEYKDVPPNYSAGDWVWATYHHISGLWLLVGGYQEIWPAKVIDHEWGAGDIGTVQLAPQPEDETDETVSPIQVQCWDEHNLISLSPAAIRCYVQEHAPVLKQLPIDTPVILYRNHDHYVLLQIGCQDKWEEEFWGRITSYEQTQPGRWNYTVQLLETLGNVIARNAAEYSPDVFDRLPRLPIPKETIVRVFRYYERDVDDPDNILLKYQFFATNQLDGYTGDQMVLTRLDTTLGRLDLIKQRLRFTHGHLEEVAPEEWAGTVGNLAQGPIAVGGDLVPGEAAGQFFPVPGLWNGMPQWRHAQNPNWWIRWNQQPGAGGGGAGCWVIGNWPPGAQEPEKGWMKRPPPQPGEPADLNPIGEFPETIGDVDGVPHTITTDYIVEDCTAASTYHELVMSNGLNLQQNEVIYWKDDQGMYRCGKVSDPDMPPEAIQKQTAWRVYGRFLTCQECGVEYVLEDCTNPGVRWKLQGARDEYSWQEGQIIRFARMTVSDWEVVCGKVLPAPCQHTHEASRGAWTFLGVFANCQDCLETEWPEPSSPSEPCSPYYQQLRVTRSLPEGLYQYGGADRNGKCWWGQSDWVIAYVEGEGWMIINLEDPEEWWIQVDEGQNDVRGIYRPSPKMSEHGSVRVTLP